MSSPPWMPLYVADYLRDTTHLGTAEHGAYCLLIMAYWVNGGLPDDDRQLARIVRCSDRQWRSMRPLIEPMFQKGWKHKRIDEELENARAKAEKRATAGRAGGEAKALKNKDTALANATVLPEQNPSIALASSSDSTLVVSSQSSDTCPKRVRTRYPDDFETFWGDYPTDANMSKKEAHDVWRRLSSDAKTKAIASLPAFRAHCQANPDYRPIHACRYLLKERYEGFAAVAEKSAAVAGVYIKQGEAGWDEWQAVKKTPTDAKGGWWFPSKYPAETQHRSAA